MCEANPVTCLNSGFCEQGVCACPEGTLGENCETIDYTKIQAVLRLGISPFELLANGAPIDSLYGKNFQGGRIFYLDVTNNTGLMALGVIGNTYHWGCMGLELGVKNEELNMGMLNSELIKEKCNDSPIAAGFLRPNTAINAQIDWYLPSKEELNLVWNVLADPDQDGINTGPSDPNNLEEYTGIYWTLNRIRFQSSMGTRL